MANGSIESKGESDVWPAEDVAQTQPSSRHPQDPSTPGDPNHNLQAANHLPPFPPPHPHPHPRPSSPISVAELQERAVQDSQNNNVDENSNDRHYDQYAAIGGGAYSGWEASLQPTYPSREASHLAHSNLPSRDSFSHQHSQETLHPSYSRREASSFLNREASSQQNSEASHAHSSQETQSFHPSRETTHHSYSGQDYPSHHLYSHPSWEAASHPADQSVRPRVRQAPQHLRDEPDRALPPRQHVTARRDSDSSTGTWQHSGVKHRRNQSEGTGRYYPPLPNLNCPSDNSGELPHLPGYEGGSHNPNTSQGLQPFSLGGGSGNPHLQVALRSTERVTQEAEELLTTFTSETLRNNRLEVPHWMMAMPSPHMVRAGRELRLLADAFACTDERRKVRLMAESVNLGCIEMDDFLHLCAELFYDGITRERIVALFTFVGDVAVHQMKLRGEELIHRLMKWSLKYLVEHVCRWVQEAGGWIAVLTCGANLLYRCAVFVFCVCGSVAAGLFIYKTLKNG